MKATERRASRCLLVPILLVLALTPGIARAQSDKGGEEKVEQTAKPPITASQEAGFKKSMRRQAQSGNHDGLRATVKTVLARAEPGRDRNLLRYAAFYKAGLCGLDGQEEECWEWIEKAIGYGYLNAEGFATFKLLPETIKDSPKFQERLKKLRSDADVLVKREFEAEIEASLKNPGPHLETLSGVLSGKGLGPTPLSPDLIRGRPALLVITPYLHDGFDKEVHELNELARKYGKEIAFGVLFAQYALEDADQVELARKYIEKIDLTVPAMAVDREYLRPLEIPYYPAHLFLNREGQVAYRAHGYLEKEKLENILTRLVKSDPPADKSDPPANKGKEKDNDNDKNDKDKNDNDKEE